MTLPVGGLISGTVRVAQPIRGLCVEAFSSIENVSIAPVASNGEYRVEGLPTGSYTVVFNDCPVRGDNYEISTDPNRVHVTAGQVTAGVNWTLRIGGTITGTVTSAGGVAVPGSCVFVFTPSGGPAGAISETGPSGRYSSNGLPTGEYELEFLPACGAGGDLAPEWSGESPTMAGATPVHVVAGQTTAGVDVRLQPDGSITGTATDSSGDGLPGICVTAVSLTRGAFDYLTSTVVGSYDLVGLPVGRYKVEFTSSCGSPTSYVTQWYRNAASEKSAKTITVNAGAATSGIDAELAT